MNKKVTALILAFVMVVAMLVPMVPAYAAGSNELVITPDKTKANPGDTITYTVKLGPIENFQSANFTLVIPDGLTFVSGTVAEGLAELTGATEAGFENSTLTFYHGGLEAYTSTKDTTLMTFTCTVDADAMGDYTVEIMDDYDFANNAWTSYDMTINTAASKVTVEEKSIEETKISLNKTALTLKAGASETLVATVTPAGETVTWTSGSNAVATVNASGKVVAVAKGSTTITAKAGTATATCVVTVEEDTQVDPSAAQIAFESKTVLQGSTLVVELQAKNVPAVKSMMIDNFQFDDENLELVESDLLLDAVITDWDESSMIATVAFAENTDINGAIMTFTFQVKEEIEGEFPISCDVYVNQMDETGHDVQMDVAAVPGVITVLRFARGDVNGDDIVNSNDAIHLLRYTIFASSYPINQNGDMNGDGIVNSNDAIHLLRHTIFPSNYPLS